MTERVEMTTNADIVSADKAIISPAFRVPLAPVAIEEGNGARVKDIEGKEYIDLFGSAAVANVGHGNRKVINAIVQQAAKLIHYTPANVYSASVVELAKKLNEITPGDFDKKIRFGLSGSDANDGAIKFARAYTGRYKIISFINSYHGSTYGALSLSGLSLNMRRKLGPGVPEVYHVPYADCYRCPFAKGDYPGCDLYCIEYIEEVILKTIVPPEEVAAIFVEPIQGDAGIVVPPDEFHPRLKQICEKHGILFVDDEVQMGFGRTGQWFGIEHWGIKPDMVVLGKAIASGMPLSAVVAKKEIMEALEPPADIFSCQGNPICCKAAIATIEEIHTKKLVQKSYADGEYMKEKLLKLKGKLSLIGDVRGTGLCIGVDLVKDRATKERATTEALKVCWRCFENGIILASVHGSVLRIIPPLVITREEIDKSVDIIQDSIYEVEKGNVPDSVIDRVG